MRVVALLALLGWIPPEAWDAVVGQGPLLRYRGDRVALNPQPLPPRDPFLSGAALMAHEVVGLAVESDLRGQFSADLVHQLVDDWCGTPWPRKWPWPWPGPRPDEGPSPDPWRIDAGRAIGALVFASAGSRLAEGDVRTALLEGAERLAEAATGG
jgi:hypothetical protein